jgi:uncharacterized membrane protein
MATDTFMAYVGVYSSVDDAEADYDAIHDVHAEVGLVDAYDAAVIERPDNGEVKVTVVRKRATPTRVGGVSGGTAGLATGLVIALFPAAVLSRELLAATTGRRAALGALAGHAAAGMSRKDLEDLGEHLDTGRAALVVVAVSDMGAGIDEAMGHADAVHEKQLEADTAEIRRDTRPTS